MNISCRYALVMSLSVAMSSVMASQPVVPAEQIQKELVAEKAQWVYVQKTLTEKLPLPKTLLKKLCRTLVAHGAGIAGGLLVFTSGACCMKLLENKTALVCVVVYLTVFVSLSSIVLIANTVDRLLENKSGVYTKALTSFISKWPEHKAQTPESLQGTFDILYANRQTKDGSLTDKQAQALVEGILALSVVAQGA